MKVLSAYQKECGYNSHFWAGSVRHRFSENVIQVHFWLRDSHSVVNRAYRFYFISQTWRLIHKGNRKISHAMFVDKYSRRRVTIKSRLATNIFRNGIFVNFKVAKKVTLIYRGKKTGTSFWDELEAPCQGNSATRFFLSDTIRNNIIPF